MERRPAVHLIEKNNMPYELISTGEATAILPTTNSNTKPITVIGTESIRNTFDDGCLQQAINSRLAPGVTDLVLNPDAHCGYGAPVGCVMVSPRISIRVLSESTSSAQ